MSVECLSACSSNANANAALNTVFNATLNGALSAALVASAPVISNRLERLGKKHEIKIDQMLLGVEFETEEEIAPLKYISADNRLILKPVPRERTAIWELYKKSEAVSWTADEVDLKNDKGHYLNLKPEEQYFVKRVLSLFAPFDKIVNMNVKALSSMVKIIECELFFNFQMAMEDRHSETYTDMHACIFDNRHLEAEIALLTEDKIIKKMINWAQKYKSPTRKTFAAALFANACVEGVFFSGAFCAIFWLQKRGLMPGFSFANELISRDEGLHVEHYAHINDLILESYELSYDERIAILKEAVEFSKEFINDALQVKLVDMNATLMTQYIQYVADNLLAIFNAKPYYKSKNPFDFMEQINLFNKTNFFEKRVAEYQLNYDYGDGIEKPIYSIGEEEF